MRHNYRSPRAAAPESACSRANAPQPEARVPQQEKPVSHNQRSPCVPQAGKKPARCKEDPVQPKKDIMDKETTRYYSKSRRLKR